MIEEHRQLFKEEAAELLAQLESSLLELEKNQEDPEIIDRIFRALHTIKGSGAMFGFEEISRFAHEIESVYDLVRAGELTVNKDLIDLTLGAGDQIKKMLGYEKRPDEELHQANEEFLHAFQALVEFQKSEAHAGKSVEKARPRENITYRIRFHPIKEIFLSGTNPIPLLQELHELGDCTVIAHLERIPPLDELNPDYCYTYWDIFLTSSAGLNAIKDVFIFVEDKCELSIDVIDQKGTFEDETDYKKLGEILVERGDISTKDLKEALKKQKRLGDVLIETGVTSKDHVKAALVEQQHVREWKKQQKELESCLNIRVSSEKLDRLVNLVGELVTVQALLTQTVAEKDDPRLASIAEEVEHLTEELRENAMSIRMVPIGITFSKFRRMVRDLAGDLHKEVDLITSGAETELDKNVIEKLNDPLLHLIRNSIDHGIEVPEVREAEGKPRRGTIQLSAEHSGANVLIKIKDDGAGIDLEGVRKKAIEKGLLSEQDEVSEKEILAQIFTPGFSTAPTVSEISGRGVGMDVVKKTIESLRGTIEVKSEKGKGTLIILHIPLTLAIIEGLLVTIGDERFIMPLSMVEECIELSNQKLDNTYGRHLVNVRGQIVPFVRLRDQFEFEAETPLLEQIVITRIEGEKIGFVVDNVIGEHQTVIKSLGRVYRSLEGISGATILGDGSIALILDLLSLAHLARKEKEKLDESVQVDG